MPIYNLRWPCYLPACLFIGDICHYPPVINRSWGFDPRKVHKRQIKTIIQKVSQLLLFTEPKCQNVAKKNMLSH